MNPEINEYERYSQLYAQNYTLKQENAALSAEVQRLKGELEKKERELNATEDRVLPYVVGG